MLLGRKECVEGVEEVGGVVVPPEAQFWVARHAGHITSPPPPAEEREMEVDLSDME